MVDKYQQLSRPDLGRILQAVVQDGVDAQQLVTYLYQLGENAKVLADAVDNASTGGGGPVGRYITGFTSSKAGTTTTITITYSDGTTDDFRVTDGTDGTDGAAGVTVTSIVTNANGSITVTYSDGQAFTIPKGEAGRGIRSIVRATDGSGVVTVTYDDGSTNTFTLMDGVDGTGYEDIFALYSADTLPADYNPDNDWGFDEGGDVTHDGVTVTWTDGAPAPTDDNPYIFRARRKIVGSPDEGDEVEADWQTPVLFSRPGVDGSDGQDGNDARGLEFIFCRYNNDTFPTAFHPDNDWGFDQPEAITSGGVTVTWTDGGQGLNASNRYLYRSHRSITGDPAVGDSVSGTWSTPIIIGAYGVKGDAGPQGNYEIKAYRAVAEGATAPSTPTGGDVNTPPSGWTYSLPSLTNRDVYQSVAIYYPGTMTLSLWSTPFQVGAEGPTGPPGPPGTPGGDGTDGVDGRDGQDGADGVGREYIFCKYNSAALPSAYNPLNSWTYDNPRAITSNGVTVVWTDAAPDLDATNQYLFRAERKVTGSPSQGDAVADSWTDPTVVGRYGPQGIDGADGADAAGREYIFCKYSADTLPSQYRPINSWTYDRPQSIEHNGVTVVWEDGAPNLDATNQYLYRAERDTTGSPNSGDEVAGLWSVPRVVGRFGLDGTDGTDGIDGRDGLDGSDGTDGHPGEDGKGKEYIFCVHDTANLPANQRPLNSWGYDSPLTAGGKNWTDGAQEVTVTNQYLFRAERETVGSPATGDAVSDNWTVPVVVGRFGPAGTDGTDGIDGADGTDGQPGEDGVGREYIFCKNDSATLDANELPDNAWGYDSPQTTAGGKRWHDAAVGIDAANPYLFRAERKTAGAPNTNDAISDNWTSPVVVGRFGPAGTDGQDGQDGLNGIDGADGADGQDGRDGTDGKGLEYIFCVHDSPTLPSNQRPLDSWDYDRPGSVNGKTWNDAAPNLDDDNPYLFRSQRVIVGSPAAGTTVDDAWTIPIIVGRWGRNGVRGEQGPQGDYEVKIYRAVSTGANAPATPTGGDKDNAPTGWTFTLPSLDNRDVYQSVATYFPRTSTLSVWSAPFQVGAEGPPGPRGQPGIDGIDGSDGEDAKGREWIFCIHNSDTLPPSQHPDNGWGYDNPETRGGKRWHDAAPSLTTANKYLFSSSREIVGSPANNAAVADRWTAPAVVGRYADDGIAGRDGTDGKGKEYIFCVNDTNSLDANEYPDNSWGYENPQTTSGGKRWHDGAPSLDATNQYLFRSDRDTVGSPDYDDDVSDNWSTPRVVGRFGIDGRPGTDGQDGRDGTDGTDGQDGNDGQQGPRGLRGLAGENAPGWEFIFTVYSSSTLPSEFSPSNDWGFDQPDEITHEGVTLEWTDGAQDVTVTNRFLFQAQRRIYGTPSVGAEVTATWSEPKVVGYYGEPGADGADGTSVGVRSITANSNGSRTVTFTDGSTFTIPKGDPGTAGRGIASIERDADSGTVTITYTDGTQATFVIMDGASGEDGVGLEDIYAAYDEDDLPEALWPDDSWPYAQPQRATTDTEETLNVPANQTYGGGTYTIEPNQGSRPEITEESFKPSNSRRFLAVLRFSVNGRVQLNLANSQTQSSSAGGQDFSTDFESRGTIEVTLTRGATVHKVSFQIGGLDTREEYNFTPTNAAEVRAFVALARAGGSGHFSAAVRLSIAGESVQWSVSQPLATVANPYIYKASRKVTGAPEAGDTISFGWSDPILVTQRGRDGSDGQDGRDGEDGRDGDSTKFYPWRFGLPYDNRNQNSVVTSSGGAWQLKTSSGNVGTADPIPWGTIREIVVSDRDADGTSRQIMYSSQTMAKGNLIVAIRRVKADGTHDQVAFQMTGKPTVVNGVSASIPVSRADIGDTWDEGTINDIDPPLDSNYKVFLLLPDLPDIQSFEKGRFAGWYWRYVSASIANSVNGTDDSADWSDEAVEQANEATPGPNVAGDIVTLYRGSISKTRAWDSTQKKWVHIGQLISGNLIVHGSIQADQIGTRAVTTDKLNAGSVTTDKLAAASITGDKVSVGTLTGDKLAAETITADKLAARTVTAEKIDSNVFNVSVLHEAIFSLSTTPQAILLRENWYDNYDAYVFEAGAYGDNAFASVWVKKTQIPSTVYSTRPSNIIGYRTTSFSRTRAVSYFTSGGDQADIRIRVWRKSATECWVSSVDKDWISSIIGLRSPDADSAPSTTNNPPSSSGSGGTTPTTPAPTLPQTPPVPTITSVSANSADRGERDVTEISALCSAVTGATSYDWLVNGYQYYQDRGRSFSAVLDGSYGSVSFQVRSRNANGTSAWSSSRTATV